MGQNYLIHIKYNIETDIANFINTRLVVDS